MSMDRKIKKKRWTPKRIVILSLSGLFMIFVIYTLLTIKSNQLRVNKERLTVSTVTKGPFQEFIPILGEVIPIDTRYLVATEGGRIEKIFAKPGLFVAQRVEI